MIFSETAQKFNQKLWFRPLIFFISLILFSPQAGAGQFSVPDTGQTTCYDVDGNEIYPCPQQGEPFYGQDACYTTINPPSYTKLDENGNDLSDTAASWTMVRNNVTGLIWEVKTDDGSIHDRDNEYTWYDSNPETNGGDAGTPGDGTDTEDFINELNAQNYGGHSDWRLPTVQELASIANYGGYYPAVNMDYFPETRSSYYWSSSTYANNSVYAWGVYFYSGPVNGSNKSSSYYVRAVRAGQSVIGPFDNLVISISASKTSGVVPMETALSCTVESGQPPYAYTWDFGDGSTESNDQNPSHTYENLGTFTAACTVTDASGQTVTDTLTIQASTSNIYYYDNDSDGYGNLDSPFEAFSQPSGYVTDNTDCNDYDSSIHPGAAEIRGDGIDQDCDGWDLPFYQDTLVLTDTDPNAVITTGSVFQVYGTAGANSITLENGADAELINFSGNNIVTIQSASSVFTVFRSGATVTFEELDGTVLKMPATTTAQSIVFDDGPRSLVIDSGRVMLGDQVIEQTPAAIESIL